MNTPSQEAQTVTSGGGVVVNPQGLVLIVNQDNRSWSLPKGHLTPGETERQAAEREIAEESGITQLTYVKNLGTYERFQIGLDGKDNTDVRKRITMFLYTTSQTDLYPADSHNPEARWVAPDAVAYLLTHPKDKEFFIGAIGEVEQLHA